MSDLYFAVEGGLSLQLARQHVADHIASIERNRKLIEPLAVEEYWCSMLDGAVTAVRFSGAVHPDFKKPARQGQSSPKKGTEWARLFNENPGYDARGYELARVLGVPTTLRFHNDESQGATSLSRGFTSGCGFLWLSPDGPFALYVPDVASKVAKYEADGYEVDAACKGFAPVFDGARPILKEEWELLVAQHKLSEAKLESAA